MSGGKIFMKIDLEEELYPREKYLSKVRGFYHEHGIIKVFVGVRRCGKSSIMKLIIKELLDSGVNEDNVLYFHLDQNPYTNIDTPTKLNRLIAKHSKNIKGMKYLFIDEIQNVEGFEKIINAYNEENDFSIFITGSNSYLLSSELTTKLTGRHIEFKTMPLSFDEYLGMKGFLGKTISDDLSELTNYIYEGGFPFTVKLSSLDDKRTYVQSLIDEIYTKDIRRRVTIRNRSVFDQVMRYVINNYGSTTSLDNIVADFKKIGIAIKRETVKRYIDALIAAKVLCECDRFDMKSRKSLQGEKKYYLSDLSFYFALNTDNRINFGPTLENILYTYALSKGYSVSVGRIGKLECDFILRDNVMNYVYVQVAYTILESKDTEDREYKSLEAITFDNYPKYVLTTDTLLQKRNGIIHENIMRFIKENRTF